MTAADVVEDAVQQHPDAAVGGRGEERVEVGVVAQARVDPPVVGGVVAVRLRLEDRAEREAVGPQLRDVLQPGGQLPEPVDDGRGGVALPLGADEPQRIDVPPDDVLDPVRFRAHTTQPGIRVAGRASGRCGRAVHVGGPRDGDPVPHLDLRRPAHAYFFGFAQTDGCLYAGRGQKGRFSIELSVRDESVLHSFAALFDVYSRVSYRERRTNFGPHRSAVWSVSDLAFRRELVDLGLPSGRKAGTVAPPACPVSLPDYARGLLDGDGSVGFTRTGLPFVSFVTASRPLAEFFCAQALAVAGVHRTIGRNTRDGVFNPMVAGDPAAPFAAWLYPDGCLALERKQEAAARVAAWTRPAGMRARPAFGARRWTAAEDADVFIGSIREAAGRLGRSEKSVTIRRVRLRKAGSARSPGVRVEE